MNRRFRNQAASLLTTMALLPGAGVEAQAPPTPPSAQAAVTTAVPGADRLTPSELEQLLGPIALYPDPLLANVLAASVYPLEVAEAAKFIAGGGKPEAVDAKSWEAPVKAVAKIPDAIKMMGQYNDWTIALGQAYLVQAKDVMDVVQSLRKKAQANGALKTSPQQKVVVEQQVIYIKPADPEIIYVPTYSPSVVYVQQQPSNNDAVVAGVVGFGLGVAAGLIIANNLDCNYHGGSVGYGWGGGDVNVNVNRNTNINNTNTNVNRNNVKNTANVGNRVGNEGNAWAPNKSKNMASQQPSQLNQFKGGPTAANRANVPGGKTPAAGLGASPVGRASAQPAARPSAQPSYGSNGGGQSKSAPGASPSAFSGGSDTQAASQRGASSRSQSAGSSSRSAPSRSGGGGGGRGGGGRGR